MERIISTVGEKYADAALDLVEKAFTDHKDAAEGRMVRRLIKEIRSKKYYLPELELVMVNELDEVIGYCMFSRFHIEGRYEDELLMLTPVAVKTELQRRHISKELLEYGLQKAREYGYAAVLVEGDPANYHARGFKTSAGYGIVASERVHLPRVECLMIQELIPGALNHIHGAVDYSFYDALSE